MYYCTFLNREAGPFTREEIYTLIREGQLQKQSLITCEGETKAAEEWPEFKILFSVENTTPPTEKIENSNLAQDIPQAESLNPHIERFVKGFLRLASGILLFFLFVDFQGAVIDVPTIPKDSPLYMTPHQRHIHQAYVITFTIIPGIIILKNLNDKRFSKNPKKCVCKLFLLGFTIIVINFLIYYPFGEFILSEFGHVGHAMVLLDIYVPYTIAVGCVAAYYCS